MIQHSSNHKIQPLMNACFPIIVDKNYTATGKRKHHPRLVWPAVSGGFYFGFASRMLYGSADSLLAHDPDSIWCRARGETFENDFLV